MTDMLIPDPTITGYPAPMSRTGKVNGSMHAPIMQAFLPIVEDIQTFGSVSPFGVESGCLGFGITVF